jgi:hypothetical protein
MQIFVEESKFLDPDLCRDLLALHKKYYPRIGRPIDLNHRECLDLYEVCHFLTTDTRYNDADVVKKVLAKITNHSTAVLPETFINYAQIVKWNVDSYQPTHVDFDYHDLTSIIYLNNEFQGGQTIVDNVPIKIEIGKIVTFSGNIIEHSVMPVRNNERYTLSVWYKK